MREFILFLLSLTERSMDRGTVLCSQTRLVYQWAYVPFVGRTVTSLILCLPIHVRIPLFVGHVSPLILPTVTQMGNLYYPPNNNASLQPGADCLILQPTFQGGANSCPKKFYNISLRTVLSAHQFPSVWNTLGALALMYALFSSCMYSL